MKNLLLAAVAVVALVTPAIATYTECTVTKEISLASRPGGHSEPRYLTVNKGDTKLHIGKAIKVGGL
jgi:hypothetical protein